MGIITGNADIIISANNNEEVMVLPIVPPISVSSPQDNTEFKTADKGSMNMIGNLGLRTFSISSYFPIYETGRMRPGSVANPWLYVDFFNKWRHELVPFRVIASRPDGQLWFNLAMTIDDFSYEVLKMGHIKYSLSMTEYPFYQELI